MSDVSHVINFDVPNTPEAYTHRIGRTGRSEQEGVARTFVTGEDRSWVRATERMIGSPIRREPVEGFEPGPNDRLEANGSRRPGRPGGQPRGGRAVGRSGGGRSGGGRSGGRPRRGGRSSGSRSRGRAR